MDSFIWQALAAGIGVALIAAPLGVFLVWRRMAYFGDTLAHSALLGLALGLLLDIDFNLAVMAVAMSVALVLLLLQRGGRLALDTLLGILAHAALSLGLVAVAFVEGVRVDLMGYLFGDILAVTLGDIAWVWGAGALALMLLALLWRPLLALTVHEELARVEGIRVDLIQAVFLLLVALVIAVSMKIVGVLLITSLMIIPAATARRLSRTPEQMALLAALTGISSVALGLAGSLQWDTPTGPSIVVASALLFTSSRVLPSR
ncbi:MAG: metal ABC transporter permease [Gammaproteobacteria bacterium]|nr:metal ABC transporter permease [Gammaproteobacteria bacterium]MBU1654971.1 metal ABC transporter permease [Gammaproteobacteria bacterium]MBU1960063.1 metal ABC transporter permease [Gammaproteobacteria bacterium]